MGTFGAFWGSMYWLGGRNRANVVNLLCFTVVGALAWAILPYIVRVVGK